MRENEDLEGASMDDGQAGPRAIQPRRTRRYTGEKLGDRIPLVQALVTKGDSFSSIAKQLKISRHSVRGIARRMREEGCASPERVEQIRRSIGGQFALLADRSLRTVDDRKLRQTGAYELTRIAAIAAERAGLVNASSSSSITLIQQNYGLQLCDRVSTPAKPIDIPPSNGHGQSSE